MNASSGTEVPPLEPPHKEPSTVEIEQRKGNLSKISGGGVGTLIVWLSDRLHFTEDQRLLAAAAATWIAVGISWAGPALADEVLRYGKYIRAKYFLKQLNNELAKIPSFRPGHRS